MKRNKVAGFIGDHYSSTTIPIAQLLGVYGYSQISYGATDYSLSNKHLYPHFFRMHNSDLIYHKIIFQILKYFGWTWVGILASNDIEAETETQAVIKYLTSNGICVAFSVKFGFTLHSNRDEELRKINIIQTSSAQIIILCGSFNIDVLKVLFYSANVFYGKTLILTPSWASNTYQTGHYFEALNSSLVIDLYSLMVPQYDRMNQETISINMLIKNPFLTAMLYALHQMDSYLKRKFKGIDIKTYNYKNKWLVPTKSGARKNSLIVLMLWLISVYMLLFSYIKNIVIRAGNLNLTFDENGEISYTYIIDNWIRLPNWRINVKRVGNYTETSPEGKKVFINPKQITWKTKNQLVPKSQCSDNCLPGYRKMQKSGVHTCCYECSHCPEGEISNISDSENCIKCRDIEWPNENKTQCIPKLVEFLSYTNDIIVAVFLCVFVFLFLIIIVILVIFYIFRNTAIVKANNKNLSFILLVFIMLSFLCVFLFIGHPVDVTCMLRQSTFAIIFSVEISCVLGKTVMIYMAFKASKPGSTWGKWVSAKAANCVVLILSTVQIILNITWLTVSPPFQELDAYSYQGKIIIQCNEGSVIFFYSVLGYMGFLAAVSFIIAFLARKLPDIFNEAKYITFSMLVFCSVWIAVIPAYLSTKGKYMVAVEIFAILTSSAGLLFCLYLPKCYIILLKPEMNKKTYLLASNWKFNY
ncbi:vomeronasal type-2 receptor 26-like, partial [Pelobates cultripes]